MVQALRVIGVPSTKTDTTIACHAGAGGVGSMAIQLAKARGAYVITTAGPKNIDFVVKVGCKAD